MSDSMPIADTASPLAGNSSAENSPLTDRRIEIEAKQNRVALLLAECGADGLLLLDPANMAWISGAALTHGIPDPADWPALYLTATQRWLISCNLDTQRIFDQCLDGLGFQLKEWPWNWGRDRLLTDIRLNRRVASDRVLPGSVPLGPSLRRIRCTLTSAEQTRFRVLGAAVAHAVEATCRTLEAGQNEQEVAGQLSHRLVHHGIYPVALTAAANGRASLHSRPGVSDAVVTSSCLVATTAMRSGLHVTATRTVCFGPPGDEFRGQNEAACRIVAALAAMGMPGTSSAAVLHAGERVARLGDHDDAWRAGPPGHVTGWLPVERPLPAGTSMVFEEGWAVIWRAAIGPALCADTYLIAAPPECVTPTEAGLWPIKRVTVQGLTVAVPDLLVR